MLVDSHCHLDFPDFAPDRAGIVARARNAGVGIMVTIGTRLSKFAEVRAIAESDPAIYCSVGVHPHEAEKEGVGDPAPLLAAAAHPKVVGIGETGLDYFYKHSDPAAQDRSFRAHIAAARETGLPLIVHARDADTDAMRILAEEHARGPYPGVIHCFTASRALAEHCVGLGLYISFSGILTFKNARDIQETAKALPLDRILVETDAPFLAPVPNRGKRNEPAFVTHTAACLAMLRNKTSSEIAEITTENFFRLFTKVSRPQAAEAAA
ncbi:MAG: TatD family hydrolase [Rhodospirillaceae bacterium]|nr:TatD family hydrolase [Rhodospirillaceae bacterium]